MRDPSVNVVVIAFHIGGLDLNLYVYDDSQALMEKLIFRFWNNSNPAKHEVEELFICA